MIGISKKKLIGVIVIAACSNNVLYAEEVTTTTQTTTTSSEQPIAATTESSTVQKATTTQTITTTKVTDYDEAITAAVYDKFSKDAALIGTQLTVKTEDNVVTISGTVTAQSQADQAVILGKSIPGVKNVISNIHVITNPIKTPPPPPKY